MMRVSLPSYQQFLSTIPINNPTMRCHLISGAGDMRDLVSLFKAVLLSQRKHGISQQWSPCPHNSCHPVAPPHISLAACLPVCVVCAVKYYVLDLPSWRLLNLAATTGHYTLRQVIQITHEGAKNFRVIPWLKGGNVGHLNQNYYWIAQFEHALLTCISRMVWWQW